MIHSKSCPRCNGDMLREELLGEVEMVCLQCGHRTALAQAKPAFALAKVRAQRREEREQRKAA